MEFPHPIIETLFNHGDAVLFVWGNERGWPVNQVSENLTRILGYKPEQFVSRQIMFADLVHPEDLQVLGEAVQTAIDTNAPTCVHDDYRIQHADGRWIWVHDATVIERNEAGNVTSFVGYLQDVTEKHESSEALAKQRDRLQLVLEGTRLGLWDWNPQTNEVTFDDRWAQMLGYELHEIELKLESWSSRVHPDDLAQCYEAIQTHMDGKVDYYENIHRMRHKDGRWVYILDRGRICEWDANGKPTRFTGTHTDITAQKKAELQAQRANQAKSEFLARMSHEIRTPLNGVLGVMQLLETTNLDQKQQEYVEVVCESGDTLVTIINDVLDSSKIEVGKMQIESRPFEVRKMLRTVHQLYQERALAKGIDYALEIDDSVPECLQGDPHRIRQVLSNLLSNAFKFTEEGRVALTAHAEELPDGKVELLMSVQDTGVGIEDPKVVWQPFGQADASTSRLYGGTGLGLSICRQLTKLMQGEMQLATEFGAGTEFSIVLPLQLATRESMQTKDKVRRALPTLPNLDVLVAEDNAINQMVISSVLKHLGQRVTVVENGLAALEECRQRNFDLVFMDIHMPEMNGIEASQKIHAELPKDRQPRIVALSADAFAPNQDKFGDAKFDGAVAKPFKVADIAQAIRDSIPQRVS